MFGSPDVRNDPHNWLNQLQQADPTTGRGALIHRSLLEDANVCEAYREQFRQFVAGQPAPTIPAEAVAHFLAFLVDLHQPTPGCAGPDNAHNELPQVPFPRLARAVAGDAFVKYNFLVGNKRKVPRHYRDKRQVQSKVRMNELNRKGVSPPALRGNIGGSVVFATSSDVVHQYQRGEVDGDGLRNRLGLDDAQVFGRDQYMVVYVYTAERVPHGKCYRPTVFDAGWEGAAIAFLPSPASPAQPGRTQDLATGQRAEPEILHDAFPAREVEQCVVIGPLSEDPPDTYKSVRLGISTTHQP